MKEYLIIDTRNFDVRCVLIGHQKDCIIILENRQYLASCDQKIWENKFPRIIEKIQNDYPDKKMVFLFPESVCLNLTVEIPENNHFTIEQRIAHVLYKNFQYYTSKISFRYFNLDKNRYAVVVIAKKFLKFIRKCFSLSKAENFMVFPPFVCLLSYFRCLSQDETSMAIFCENGLRRFFIKDKSEINFIDFYQSVNSFKTSSMKDVKLMQQLIFQGLNVDSKNKTLFLLGDVPEGLSEVMAEESKTNIHEIHSLEVVSGFLENISLASQCIYVGLDDMIKTKDCLGSSFDFAPVIFQNALLQKLKSFIEKNKILASSFLIIWFLISVSFLGYKGYEVRGLQRCFVAYEALKNDINKIKECNKVWKIQNDVRTYIPSLFLKCYDVFQTIPGDFCIDGIRINTEGKKSFCYINGRVFKDDWLRFKEKVEKFLKPQLKLKKIHLETEKLDNKKLYYRIKFFVEIPEQLQ